jgi:3-deoxy-D-manno-octulosonic acid kinase
VQRNGLVYKADIITALIPNTVTLSALLRRDGAAKQVWQGIGRMVSEFHAYGVDHPDLTAHNILVDDKDDVFLVDFDNAVVRPRGDWRQRGIARLERSLRKVALEFGVAFSDEAWRALISEYDPRT